MTGKDNSDTTMSAPLTDAQRALLTLLQSKAGATITAQQILAATNWKPATWKAYWSKGFYAPFLVEQQDGSFAIKSKADLDDWTFLAQVTQTASSREVGAPCKASLARALVIKI